MRVRQSWDFHVGAWLVWLAAALLSALTTRNPFYMGLVMLSALLVKRQLGRGSRLSPAQAPGSEAEQRAPGGTAFSLFMRAVASIFLLVAVLKGLSIHIGATVLFKFSEGWPVIGGPVTLEGLSFAALDAFSLMTVLSVVAAFSSGADYYGLLRSVPAFMHQVGLVTSIGITFVPQTLTRFVEIREAQALRGHRLRRASDLVPLVVPLLAGGMERSVNLAEAMEARGFSRAPSAARGLPPLTVQGGLALGLGLVLTGGALLAYLAPSPWVGQLCIAAGISLVGLTLWAVGRGVKRTRYRQAQWREQDSVLLVASAAVLLILLTYRFVAPSSLVYDPLARLRIYLPPFDAVLALSLLALVTPALLLHLRLGRGAAVAEPGTL